MSPARSPGTQSWPWLDRCDDTTASLAQDGDDVCSSRGCERERCAYVMHVNVKRKLTTALAVAKRRAVGALVQRVRNVRGQTERWV